MAITIRNTYNPELKVAAGVKIDGKDAYDIIYPKTKASNIGVAGSGDDGYLTSRQFVTGEMLNKLGMSLLDKLNLTVNSANSFLTLDALGKIDINLIPTDAFLTELDATPYTGSDNPTNGDLIVYKNGEIAYMPQSALAISTAMQTALNNKLNTSLKGVASGLAELDRNGKVPLTQINDSLIGQVEYMGTWNASTNSPTLPATPTEKGQYYITSVAGTQFSKSFEVGDWIIASGTTGSLYWDKVDNTDAVSSVNAKTGVVVLDASDVGARANTWVPSYTDITGTKPPSGAQVNIIEAVQVNGTDLTITSKKVNVTRTLVGANKTFIGKSSDGYLPDNPIAGDIWFDTSD